MGYSTYLTFALGYITTLVTVYYLAIKDVPFLLNLFPKFIPFAILGTTIGIPIAVGFGWFHYKRSPAYESEVDIQYEANPYLFKLPPGYNLEVVGPLYLETLSLLKRISDRQGLITPDEKSRIEGLEKKIQTLVDGGMVGTPRRKL
jgi:hypothetical protein